MTDIPRIDAAALTDPSHWDHIRSMELLTRAATKVGFLTLYNTPIAAAEVMDLIAQYRAFFHQTAEVKSAVDMGQTGANRGWGASGSEQVDPGANPDYKEVFDCGLELPERDPHAALSVYAPNQWPEAPEGFRAAVQAYYEATTGFALKLLSAIARSIGAPANFFDAQFSRPMALLRGNFYPARPDWAGDRDFGIGAHTDYGCLTFLATDGSPGLEVQGRDGSWIAVQPPVGEFVINFGEMLEIWTAGQVVATMHRVRGTSEERISIPLFFNPNFEANVAAMGSGAVMLAGLHLTRRFEETYLHLKNA